MGTPTYTITAEPTQEPVTLSEAKKALRIEHDDDDPRILGMIRSARIFAEQYTGLYIMTQTVELSFDGWPSNIIELGVWPLASIDSVKYDDTSSPVTEQTLVADTDYYKDIKTEGGRIVTITGWPSTAVKPKPIRISMTAGYASRKVVSEQLKDGILAYVAYLDEMNCALRQTAKDILWPARIL